MDLRLVVILQRSFVMAYPNVVENLTGRQNDRDSRGLNHNRLEIRARVVYELEESYICVLPFSNIIYQSLSAKYTVMGLTPEKAVPYPEVIPYDKQSVPVPGTKRPGQTGTLDFVSSLNYH
jgi:hypothetical protein